MRARLLPPLFALFTLLFATPVLAGPPSGKSGSASFDTDKGGDASSSGFKWPQLVYGGNAISGLFPVQFGLAGYIPRVRLGAQYDVQIHKGNWAYIGIAAVLDRGRAETFDEEGVLDKAGAPLAEGETCGLSASGGDICQPGTVAGFDLYAGYVYKMYIKKAPYVVPNFRVGAGGGFWKYPHSGGARRQALINAWTLSVRPGAGIRLFLLPDLGIGLDLNFQIGFQVDRYQAMGQAAADTQARFMAGLEVLPLVVEYRF